MAIKVCCARPTTDDTVRILIRGDGVNLLRLRNAQPDVSSFYERMLIWSLAAKPTELRDGWLHVAKLCQTEHIPAGRSILQRLEQKDETVRTQRIVLSPMI